MVASRALLPAVRALFPVVAACVALTTPACAPPPATLLWAHDPQSYFNDRDFAASFFSRELVLVTHHLDRTNHLKRVIALDPRTGEERWARQPAEWVLHPPGRAAPLYLVNRVWSAEAPGAAESRDPYTEIREIDPATGKDLRIIPLPRPMPAGETSFDHAGSKILYTTVPKSGSGRVLGALDPATGAELWETPPEPSAPGEAVVLADRVIFKGKTYIARSLADGRELFRAEGECCTALASPDTRHVYIRTGIDQAGELLPDGQIGQRYAGSVEAVSSRYVAVRKQSPPANLRVYEHGGASPVWSVNAADREDFFSAVALHEDQVVFFRGGDNQLWQHDLSSGRDRVLLQVGGKLVISTDAAGVAPAYMGTPPVVDPPLLFVHDWTLRAYDLK